VTLVVRDASGRSASDQLTVHVDNVAPGVEVAPALLVTQAGQPVTLQGAFTDAGSGDSHTILWRFGDGATISDSLAPAHTFADEGTYLVRLQVTDDDGGTGDATAAIVVSGDEVCDGVDNDLDGQADDGWDANSNGVRDCEDPYLNTDGDAWNNDQDSDDDNDEFADTAEAWAGTDALDACPDNSNDDAWPLDIDKDRAVSATGDAFNYVGRIGAEPGDTNWWRRLDFDMDGDISVTGDLFIYVGRIGRTCS
jgi:hypothetical protein